MEEALLQTPEPVKSPFLDDITQCKASMRRLRKKIYKYTVTHRENRKPKHPGIQDILLLLKQRNLPNFVIDQITKKRTFDIGSIKNVIVSQEASIEEITKRAQAQEDEIKDLFTQHKDRMKTLCTPQLKIDRRTTACMSADADNSDQYWEDEDQSEEVEKENIRVS